VVVAVVGVVFWRRVEPLLVGAGEPIHHGVEAGVPCGVLVVAAVVERSRLESSGYGCGTMRPSGFDQPAWRELPARDASQVHKFRGWDSDAYQQRQTSCSLLIDRYPGRAWIVDRLAPVVAVIVCADQEARGDSVGAPAQRKRRSDPLSRPARYRHARSVGDRGRTGSGTWPSASKTVADRGRPRPARLVRTLVRTPS
jgi:hypothetical protein